VRYLLDTHAFLWLNEGTERFPPSIQDLCLSGLHQFYLSLASPWEIQIKHQIGKLALDMSVKDLVDKNCRVNHIQLLPITLPHISHLNQLPLYHRDPFDRMIIAQAIMEDLPIISMDHAFSNYPVSVVW
jgi:PIN domain nuclease of toxin-antitoxin system